MPKSSSLARPLTLLRMLREWPRVGHRDRPQTLEELDRVVLGKAALAPNR